MNKYKMPTVNEFLNKKIIYGPKKEPVWVYLEREMRENLNNKPYNEKVGAWLQFLRDFKFFKYQEDNPFLEPSDEALKKYIILTFERKSKQIEDFNGMKKKYFQQDHEEIICRGKRNLKRLQAEVGPAWYCELSELQKKVLHDLKSNIHQDMIEDIPKRTRKSLSDLGVTLKIPRSMLMKAMAESVEDAGIFIWNLYTYCYKMPPSQLRGEYEINAMILMSSLVFIDLKECIENLEKLTEPKKEEEVIVAKKYPKNFKPDVRYGDYLQKNYVPPYSKYSEMKKQNKPLPLGNKVKLRSQSSYERLCEDKQFLEKRKDRNKKEKPQERVCTYKFWEPPCTLRNSDPKLVAYLNKLKMLKKKAKPKHSTKYDNVQYHVGSVVFCGGRPHFLLNNVALLPTGYIPINGGFVQYGNDVFCNIHGYWKYPKEVKEECDDICDCVEKWDDRIMEYLNESKCKCGHLYDFYHDGKLKEHYFYPPSKHGRFWLDYAKIYQLDPMEDFIRDKFQEALMSSDLSAFLAELSDTPLIVPHLPQANLLNNLREWVRRRVKGKMSSSAHRRLLLQSQRRWLHLKHMDFRARAYRIPFTSKQLNNMNWSHRYLIQKLFEILLNDFVFRNRLKQLEQTRLWWFTTKYDAYPSEAFIDIFFTYMPGRMKDTFLINPYSSEITKKHGAKTCPLAI